MVSPGTYHTGFNSGHNVASVLSYANSSWYICTRAGAKIPITHCVPSQVGIPLQFPLWTEFRKSLNILKTH